MVALEQHHPIVDWILYPRVEDLKRLLLSEELQRTQFPEHDQEFVIAVIGDSTSNGVGVRVGQRYVDILEKKLNKIRPTRIYNFSQPGDNIVDHFVKFELSEKYLKPDLVIFALYYNDLMDLDGSRYLSNQDKLNELSVNCLPLFSEAKSSTQQLDEKEFLEAYVLPTYQEDYGNLCVYRSFLEKVEKSNTAVLYFNMAPSEDRESQDPLMVESQKIVNKTAYILEEEIEKTSDTHMFRVPDFLTHYSVVSEKELHHSSKTHEYVAEQLYTFLLNEDGGTFHFLTD